MSEDENKNKNNEQHRLRKELPDEVAPEAADGAGHADGADDAETPAAETKKPSLTGRQRLAKGLWPPRVSRAQLIVAVLLFVLGLGLAIQVRSNSDSSALRGARQEDLVRILDELDDRTQRLGDEKQRLEGSAPSWRTARTRPRRPANRRSRGNGNSAFWRAPWRRRAPGSR